jgi:hypothetical protein
MCSPQGGSGPSHQPPTPTHAPATGAGAPDEGIRIQGALPVLVPSTTYILAPVNRDPNSPGPVPDRQEFRVVGQEPLNFAFRYRLRAMYRQLKRLSHTIRKGLLSERV